MIKLKLTEQTKTANKLLSTIPILSQCANKIKENSEYVKSEIEIKKEE